MGKCIFVLFRNFFPFNWKSKLVIHYFFIIILSQQTVVDATYGLKTCCSYLGIKHIKQHY